MNTKMRILCAALLFACCGIWNCLSAQEDKELEQSLVFVFQCTFDEEKKAAAEEVYYSVLEATSKKGKALKKDGIPELSEEEVNDCREIAQTYIREQYLNDLATIVLPLCLKQMSRQEFSSGLKPVNAFRKILECSQSPYFQKKLEERGESIGLYVGSGESVPPVHPLSCSETYKAYFDTVYQTLFKEDFEKEKEILLSQLSKKESEENQRILSLGYEIYFSDVPIIMRNSCIGKVTEEEMGLVINWLNGDFAKSAFAQRIGQAVNSFDDETGAQLIMKFVNWLQEKCSEEE